MEAEEGNFYSFIVADIDNYREKHRILLNALRHVESSFIMPAPIGDGGLSIGPLQIRFVWNVLSSYPANPNLASSHCA